MSTENVLEEISGSGYDKKQNKFRKSPPSVMFILDGLIPRNEFQFCSQYVYN